MASATGIRSTAVGEGATASGNRSLSFGNLASATAANSVAIGNGATATRANQVSVGNAQNTYTFAGIGSAESEAAQTGGVGFVTSDADGNLAVNYGASGTLGALDRGVAANQAAISRNEDAISENRDRIQSNKEGIAMAMALSTPYVPADKTFAVSSSLGAFEGSSAMAVSMGYRINGNTQLDAGVTYGFDRQQVGGRIGVTYAW